MPLRKRKEVQEVPRGLKEFFSKLQLYVDRWWYLPLMGALVFADLFVAFIPSDALVVKTAMLRPRRWLYSALFMTTASALGAVLLGYLSHAYGETFITWLLGDVFRSSEWEWTTKFIDNYGFWAMAFIAISILPQQPGVAICGLAGMPLPLLFLAVWAGRAPKYVLFAYLATKAPDFYEKHLKKYVEELEAEDAANEKEEPPKPGDSSSRSSKKTD